MHPLSKFPVSFPLSQKAFLVQCIFLGFLDRSCTRAAYMSSAAINMLCLRHVHVCICRHACFGIQSNWREQQASRDIFWLHAIHIRMHATGSTYPIYVHAIEIVESDRPFWVKEQTTRAIYTHMLFALPQKQSCTHCFDVGTRVYIVVPPCNVTKRVFVWYTF